MADEQYEAIVARLDHLERELARARQAEADYFQAHKDDPTIWDDGEDAPLKVRRGRYGALVSVRLAPAEADALRDWARATGQSYSTVVREALQRALARPVALALRESCSQGTITS